MSKQINMMGYIYIYIFVKHHLYLSSLSVSLYMTVGFFLWSILPAELRDAVLRESCCFGPDLQVGEKWKIVTAFVLNGLMAPKLMWCASRWV